MSYYMWYDNIKNIRLKGIINRFLKNKIFSNKEFFISEIRSCKGGNIIKREDIIDAWFLYLNNYTNTIDFDSKQIYTTFCTTTDTYYYTTGITDTTGWLQSQPVVSTNTSGWITWTTSGNTIYTTT